MPDHAVPPGPAPSVTEARRAFGVVGRRERLPLGLALRAAGTGWHGLVALWALALADAALSMGMVLAAPGAQLSIAGGALGFLLLLRPELFVVGALAGLAWRARRARPALIARSAALVAGLALAAASLATSPVAILLAALAQCLAAGLTAAVILPMLLDAHRPEVRGRVVGGYAAAVMGGFGAASLVFVVAGGAGLTWRAALAALAATSVVVAAATWRLGDPAVGRFDQARLGVTEDTPAGPADGVPGRSVALNMGEKFNRVMAPVAVRPLLGAVGVFGMFAWALPAYLNIFLRDRWAMVAPQRSLLLGLLYLVCLPGVVWFGARADIAFRRSVRQVVGLTSSAGVIAGLALGAALVSPLFAGTFVLLVVAFVGFAGLLAGAVLVLLNLCEPDQRGHAAVVVGLVVFVGGILGQQLLDTIGSRFGIDWALISAAAVGLGVTAALLSVVVTAEAGFDALLRRLVERHQLADAGARGEHQPLLDCRGIDFSYGQVQILFEVSFTVDDGQMVALLGTNGAGKSTLLRLIAGLNHPDSGSVRYRGGDVTYLGADRRVALGISQIPGGRAVFGPLSVVDNLRAFGHAHGRNHRARDQGIEETFAAFPRLEERRNQLASTLSGGEQQMLALGKALILKPRLLLIDELSLGLAPIIVGELLGLVRTINDRGVAVVLVEQSVNIALSVVDHAYFMEKGEMRFDGAAADLIDRPDLLRSVFLQGVAEASKLVGTA